MCTNYTPSSRETLKQQFDVTGSELSEWPQETYQDYLAPIIRLREDGHREAVLASYGMVPKARIAQGVRHFSTMNARSETVGGLRSYAKHWRAMQLCLVPMQCFFEPCWEGGVHVRWRIGMADGRDFAVAGLWREWADEAGGLGYSFTQLTMNADHHPLMSRFHRPDDEKRSLVVIPEHEYDAWLHCANDDMARSFLQLYPADKMHAQPAPRARASRKSTGDVACERADSGVTEPNSGPDTPSSPQGSLF